MRRRDQWRDSHRPAAPIRYAPRTVDAIAARNRAWRELCAVLPLAGRYLNREGELA